MKKLSLIIAITLCALALAYAHMQEDFFTPPDYAQIERNVQSPSSPFYYPRLMERFLAGDSTFTTEESRHLYFGFVFQPAYTPTDTSPYNRRLATVLSRQSLSARDFDEILRYSRALLEEDPFNLRALNAIMLVYAQRDNVAGFRRADWQRRIVQDAIVSSGDGMSERTPFFVIRVAHQYDMLPLFGFRFGGEDRLLRNGRMNTLSLAENRFEIPWLYFDITPVANHLVRQGRR